MNKFLAMIEKHIVPALTSLAENRYMQAIRAGMIATVPFTIAGSFFLIISFLPISGWERIIEPYQNTLMIPVSATFGCISIIASLGVAYDLARQYKQDTIISSLLSLTIFLLLQINPQTHALDMSNLNANGLFTAILIALITVETQRFFISKNLVIKLPENVPPAVVRSFISLTPLAFLLTGFWILRFLIGININTLLTEILSPVVCSLNTLPGFLLLSLITSILWSVGIHGDNVLLAVAMPAAMDFLSANVDAHMRGLPMPYITAYGFETIFVNIGGTGATIGLVLLMLKSREPGLKKLARLSFASAIFEINEPIVFGVPVILNPIMLIPYIVTPLILTTITYFLMYFNFIARPFISLPWTTPPIIGHYLATGGDWRAALWGLISIIISAACYYPFIKIIEKQRLEQH